MATMSDEEDFSAGSDDEEEYQESEVRSGSLARRFLDRNCPAAARSLRLGSQPHQQALSQHIGLSPRAAVTQGCNIGGAASHASAPPLTSLQCAGGL